MGHASRPDASFGETSIQSITARAGTRLVQEEEQSEPPQFVETKEEEDSNKRWRTSGIIAVPLTDFQALLHLISLSCLLYDLTWKRPFSVSTT